MNHTHPGGTAAAPSPSKGFFISQLETGQEVTGQLAVLRKEVRRRQNAEPFLNLELADRTGRIAANDWDHVNEHDPVFLPGSVVKIQARVGEFNGKLQLTILRARTCLDTEYQLGDFLPASKRDPDEMFQDLCRLVGSLARPWIRNLLELLLERHAAGLKRAPAAARIHHAFVGGLLEHILSLCGAASRLCEHYPRLDRDLLLAGCVLHDIGKIRELSAAGVNIGYTTSGRLVGHIAEGLILLNDLCDALEGFQPACRLALQHLIVSHHGDLEFGALRQPATPEALALHYLDNLDAKLELAWRLIDGAAEGEEFSAYEPSLKREIWRGTPRD